MMKHSLSSTSFLLLLGVGVFVVCTFLPLAAHASIIEGGNGDDDPQHHGQQAHQQDLYQTEHHSSSLLDEVADEVHKAQRVLRHALHEIGKHSTIAGNLKPLFKKLMLSEHELAMLFKSIRETAHWEDLAVILALGWLTVPVLKMPYERMFSWPTTTPFQDTYLYLMAEHLSQIAKIALVVYFVDVIKMVCVALGIEACQMAQLPHAFAHSAYTLWGANRIVAVKQHYLRKYVSKHPEAFGRAQLLNRLADAGIYGLAVFFVWNILQIEVGVATHSILAFGSVGTLALGLASQGIITQLLNGLLLASSEHIYEGDEIRFSNGNSGTIVHLGWLETAVRGSDEIMLSIPNADLMKDHFSNLSRVRYSQVHQTLRFKYKEANKLPALLRTIKQEIMVACPDVIVDGSRPFKAYWTDYGSDYLEVKVDARFNIKPTSGQYWENRQRMLQAIQRAVKIHQVEFATPLSFVQAK